jgi:hypothetical protein
MEWPKASQSEDRHDQRCIQQINLALCDVGSKPRRDWRDWPLSRCIISLLYSVPYCKQSPKGTVIFWFRLVRRVRGETFLDADKYCTVSTVYWNWSLVRAWQESRSCTPYSTPSVIDSTVTALLLQGFRASGLQGFRASGLQGFKASSQSTHGRTASRLGTVCTVCTVLSCPVLSCPVLSCPVLSCPVLSGPRYPCVELWG